jgi:hypothetical protein
MSKRALLVGRAASALVACAVVCGSCSSTVRQGSSPAYLIIDSLTAASGAKPNDYSNFLQSDVVTIIKVTQGTDITYVPTVYADNGQVHLRIALKDIGTPGSPTSPSTNNEITVTQYHVTFKRSDGRNTPGVDVPYGFDGAVTGTVTAAATTLYFELVRAQAKFDPPLMALRSGGGAKVISTFAEITFYGRDQVGNQVSVTGTISVDFADWADPQ